VVQHEPLASPVSRGEIVAGKYRVERVLGVGGMGVVVSARHTTLDQIVAIKFLVANRFDSREEAVGRFLAEARAAAQIESDYVCRVFDVGTLPNGIPFMVMEHLEGRDLDEEIQTRGQLDLVEAVDYVLQAADALAAAHQLGIVHRDIKPANLFLAVRPDGTRRVKVLDFGISKAGEQLDVPRVTAGATTLGTPAYMSPEQVRASSDVDARTDIWGLGSILYELLTGQMAFVGDTMKAILDHVMNDDPCPMSALRRGVPSELEEIVMRCLERDRERRWPSAATFARALAPYGSVATFGQLASVQRELGSFNSIYPIRPATSGTHSMEPMVANVRSSVPTLPDLAEIRAREATVQDWSKVRARKRWARAGLTGIVTVACLVAAFVGAVHLARSSDGTSERAVGQAAAPPMAAQALPNANADANADANTNAKAPATVSSEVVKIALAAPAASAAGSVHSARGASPRPTATARPAPRPAPKGSVNHVLDTRD
jgi:serine/threonine-protein kinase